MIDFSVYDLSEIFTLFGDGLLLGGLLSGIPFVLGYTISFLVSLMKRG